jgi:hypothetical protein
VSALARSRLPLQRLLAVLPPEGSAGATSYSLPGETPGLPPLDAETAALFEDAGRASPTGSATFAFDGTVLLAVPAHPIAAPLTSGTVLAAPLVDLIERPRVFVAFLLRFGGFACGVFHGDKLIASKVGQRFVKNRNRKGGQSQRRFERIREKQVHELFAKACGAFAETVAAHESRVERVFLGGSRQTLVAFRKECAHLGRFDVSARLLNVPGEPRRASLDAIPRDLRTLDVYTLASSPVAPPPPS